MIDIKEIAKKQAREMKEVTELAKQFIVELNGEQEQLQVEEVVRSEDGKWSVILSYFRKYRTPNELQKTLGLLGSRAYKRITIIDRDGHQIVGMSDWSPERREAA
jgi:hypothetical protein